MKVRELKGHLTQFNDDDDVIVVEAYNGEGGHFELLGVNPTADDLHNSGYAYLKIS
jgi:UDP-N-acetylglucosamine pyrophosphorylase